MTDTVTRWALKEEFPWPVRACHWVFIASVVVLAITGAYIRSPFWLLGLRMGVVLYIHYTFMYVILIALTVRVYWAFFGKGSASTPDSRRIERDYRNFGPQAINRGRLLDTAAYLVFLRRARPVTAKYNGWEKVAYVFWALLLLASAYSGFAIYGLTYAWPFFKWGTDLVGGLGPMRDWHYLIMWVFVASAAVHVYLSLAEDVPAVVLILFGRETAPPRAATADRG